jgi:hypothetical protein
MLPKHIVQKTNVGVGSGSFDKKGQNNVQNYPTHRFNSRLTA